MGKKVTLTLVAVLVAIAARIAQVYYSLRPDQAWAQSYDHSADIHNLAYHSRYRGYEWTNRNEYFTQWWNYIIVDAETKQHINLGYQLSEFAKLSPFKPRASVGVTISKGSRPIATSSTDFPLDSVRILNHADLEYVDKNGEVPHSHRFLDDDTVLIVGNLPPETSSNREAISWNITLHRVHGVFLNGDVAKPDTANDTKCRSGSSSLYGCNSEVEGYIKLGDTVYTLNRTQRFRGYGGGSWGCALPHGTPAAEHPWSWMWAVVPGETGSSDDLSFTFGDGRFEDEPVITPIYGSYAIVGLPGQGKDVFTTRSISIRHKRPLEIPIIKSSSHGYFTRNHVEQHEWFNYTDDYGTALIPARQVFIAESELYRVIADARARPDQFFRLPIMLEHQLKPKVHSDFRAVGANIHLQVWSKNSTGEDTLILNKTTDALNAVEYAYEAHLNVDMNYIHGHGTAQIAKAHQLWLEKQKN